MAFNRYSADADGGFTFYDDAAGMSTRAAGPAAAQRAQELDAQAVQPFGQSPMAQGGLPPVPPRPEQQLLAAGPPTAAQIDGAGDSGTAALDAAWDQMQGQRGPPPTAPVRAGRLPVMRSTPKPSAPDPTVSDLQVGTPPTQAAPGQPAPAGQASAAGGAGGGGSSTELPAQSPDGRKLSWGPAATAPQGPLQLVESGQTIAQSGSGSSSSTSSSYQRSLGPDPKAQQHYQQALQEKFRADADVADARASAAREIAFQHDEAAFHQQELAEKQRQIEEDTQAKLQPINDKMMAVLDAYTNGKVDPNRLWKEVGTAGQISAAIAVAFGAIAQGMKGGPNQAWDVIEGAINRDIQLQVADLDKKRGEVGLLAQVGREVIAQGGDRKAAEAAMRATAINATLSRIQAFAARAEAATGSDAHSLAYAQIAKAGEAAAAAQAAEVSERVRGQVAGQSVRSTQSQSQVSKTRIDRELLPGGGTDDDSQKVFFNGKQWRLGKYIDPSEGKAIREKMVAINSLTETARRINELRDQWDRGLLTPDQFSVLSTALAEGASTVKNMGVLQGNEREYYQSAFRGLLSGKQSVQELVDLGDRIARGYLDQADAKEIGPGGGAGGVTVVGRQGTKKGKR